MLAAEDVAEPADYAAALLTLVGNANGASRRCVYEQYDTLVQGNSVVTPGSDAGIVRVGDKGKALALSGTFHLAISALAQHAVFDAMVRSLIARSSLIIALYWKRHDATCESHSHQALIKAFAANDAVNAEGLMKSHIIDLHSGLDLSERVPTGRKLAEILGG